MYSSSLFDRYRSFPRIKPRYGWDKINWRHPITRGMVGCWLANQPGSSQIVDLTNNRNNGTLQTGGQWTTGAFTNSAIKCSGASIAADFGYSASLKPTIAVSVLTWCTPLLVSSAQPNNCSVTTFYNGLAGAPPYLSYRLNGNYGNSGYISWEITSLFSSQLKNNNLQSNVALVAMKPTFLSGVYDAEVQSQSLYIDGILQATQTANGTIEYNNGHLYWGANCKNGEQFNGIVDMSIIYNRALSASEIALLNRQPFCFMRPYVPATAYFLNGITFNSISGEATFLGQTEIAASGQMGRGGFAQLCGDTMLAASSSKSANGAVYLIGESRLPSTPGVRQNGYSSLQGATLLLSNPGASQTSAAILGVNTLLFIDAGSLLLNGVAELTGDSRWSSNGQMKLAGSAKLLGETMLAGVPSKSASGTAILIGDSRLSSGSGILQGGYSSLRGAAMLRSNAGAALGASALLSNKSVLFIDVGSLLLNGITGLTGNFRLSSNGQMGFAGSVELSGATIVVASSSKSANGTVALTGDSRLSNSPGILLGGYSALSGAALLRSNGGVALASSAAIDNNMVLFIDIGSSLVLAELSLILESKLLTQPGVILSGQAGMNSLASVGGASSAKLAGSAVLKDAATLAGDGGIVLGGSYSAVALLGLASSGGLLLTPGLALTGSSGVAEPAGAVLLCSPVLLRANAAFEGRPGVVLGGESGLAIEAILGVAARQLLSAESEIGLISSLAALGGIDEILPGLRQIFLATGSIVRRQNLAAEIVRRQNVVAEIVRLQSMDGEVALVQRIIGIICREEKS